MSSRALVLAVAVLAAPALAQEPDAPTRPAYSFLRFNEDWSVLAEPLPDRDPWDAIKHVSLSDDGSTWASFGGHARLRLEDWTNVGFGAAANADDTFLLWRVTLHADVHVGEHLRAFVEGKSAGATERDLPGGRRGLDVDSLDLEQAFVDVTLDVGDGALTLRAGRQALQLGNQRLVSPLPWANTLRRWDGVSAIWKTGGWTVHGFLTQFVPVQKYAFNDPDRQTPFWGVYATGTLPDRDLGVDLYYLGLERDGVAFNGTAGDEERHTVGGRVWGGVADTGVDYEIEAAYQFGEVGAGDVSAYMLAGEIGLRLRDVWCAPRLHLGLDYASGDEAAGGDVETFNQLFPLGHKYLGYIDVIGRQNVIDLSAGVKGTPAPKLTAAVTGHLFWRADAGDALYNAGGAVVRPGAAGTSDEIGAELDVTLAYTFDRHLTGLLGYSHFFAGDFIEESGASSDIDFVYAQVQYAF